jgi:hypothetical protein
MVLAKMATERALYRLICVYIYIYIYIPENAQRRPEFVFIE